MKSRREGRSGNRRPFGVGREQRLCTGRECSLRMGREPFFAYGQRPLFAYGQRTVLVHGQRPLFAYGQRTVLVHGQRPLFAYGQGMAESRISGEGGERYAGAGAQRAFPKRKGAARGYEAGGPGTGTGTLNGRFRILPARSFLRAAALYIKRKSCL